MSAIVYLWLCGFCLERFLLPVGAWDGLRYFIVALSELSIFSFHADFDFDIVNFRSLIAKSLDVPLMMYISKLILFARASSHVTDFNNRNKSLTAKLLKQGYQYHKLCKAVSKFYRRQ